jgi:hypothetical protein
MTIITSTPTDSTPVDPLNVARRYLAADLSLLPIRRDGTKAPASEWKAYQERLPSEADLSRWYGSQKPFGIAIICGIVSGALELLDFDQRADEIWPAWRELVEAEFPGLVARLSVVKTPRPGYHVRYRCPDLPGGIPGSERLAVDPSLPVNQRVVIETRGEGGYGLAPGTPAECHEFCRLYEHIAGPPLTALENITPAEREVLIRCARSFDLSAVPEPGRDKVNGQLRPGDDFNSRGPDWPELLEPHGWVNVGTRADDAKLWCRPNKEGRGWSATTGYCAAKDGREFFAVFSSNAAPFPGPSGGRPCSMHDKFSVYALLNHGGDFKAAAKALAVQGYGEQTPRIRFGTPSTIGKSAHATADGEEKPRQVLRSIKASAVTRAPVDWLWPRWIPRGMLSILDGDPGLGKSTITADWAARVSRGWPMPPAARGTVVGEPAGVVILSAEDSAAHTIRPRLEEAGADLERITLIEAVQCGDSERPPTLPLDVDLIAELALANGVKFMVVDPFMAYLDSELNAHNDQHVRLCLHQFKLLAERTGAAVLVVRHLNKMTSVSAALYRGGGSIGIVGAARAAMVVGRDPGDPQVRVLAMNKLNIATHPRSLTYSLEAAGDVARIGWGQECDLTADEIISQPARRRAGEALQDAEEFLVDVLANGPVLSVEIKEKAKDAGIKERTLSRAKKKLKVEHYKAGFSPKTWTWKMPNDSRLGPDPTTLGPDGDGRQEPPENKGRHDRCQPDDLASVERCQETVPAADRCQPDDVGGGRENPTNSGESARPMPTGQNGQAVATVGTCQPRLVREGDGYKVYDMGTFSGKPPAETAPALPVEDDPDYWAKMDALDKQWAAEHTHGPGSERR